jgi:hypothetical protein
MRDEYSEDRDFDLGAAERSIAEFNRVGGLLPVLPVGKLADLGAVLPGSCVEDLMVGSDTSRCWRSSCS